MLGLEWRVDQDNFIPVSALDTVEVSSKVLHCYGTIESCIHGILCTNKVLYNTGLGRQCLHLSFRVIT